MELELNEPVNPKRLVSIESWPDFDRNYTENDRNHDRQWRDHWLSDSNRFRPQSIRKSAEVQLDSIFDRKSVGVRSDSISGWTPTDFYPDCDQKIVKFYSLAPWANGAGESISISVCQEMTGCYVRSDPDRLSIRLRSTLAMPRMNTGGGRTEFTRCTHVMWGKTCMRSNCYIYIYTFTILFLSFSLCISINY